MKRIAIVLCFSFAMLVFLPQRVVSRDIIKTQIIGKASSLHFLNDVMASKPKDPRVYVILGSSFLRATSFGDPKSFITKWIEERPNAVVVPISRMVTTNTVSHVQQEIVYIWIEDG